MNITKQTLIKIVAGNFFIVTGLGLFIFMLISQGQNLCTTKAAADFSTTNFKAVTTTPTSTLTKLEGDPIRLILPSLDLDLQVVPGYYNWQSKEWNVSWDRVQFATLTTKPNNIEGNTLIYGHESKGLFITLNKLKAGDLAVVRTANDHAFYYKFKKVSTTDPYDDSIFSYKGEPILTLLTCSGLFFQYRQLYTFNFVKAV